MTLHSYRTMVSACTKPVAPIILALESTRLRKVRLPISILPACYKAPEAYFRQRLRLLIEINNAAKCASFRPPLPFRMKRQPTGPGTQ
jgi:hypothetical protein